MAARRPPPISMDNVMSDEDLAVVHPEVDQLVRDNEARTRGVVGPAVEARRVVTDPVPQPQPLPRSPAAPAPTRFESPRPVSPSPAVSLAPRAAVGPARRELAPPVPTSAIAKAESPRPALPPAPPDAVPPREVAPSAAMATVESRRRAPSRAAAAPAPPPPSVQGPGTGAWQELSHGMARRGAMDPHPAATSPPAPPPDGQHEEVLATSATPEKRSTRKQKPPASVPSGQRMFVQLRLAEPVAKMFRTVAETFCVDYNAAGAMLFTYGYEALSWQRMVPPKSALP